VAFARALSEAKLRVVGSGGLRSLNYLVNPFDLIPDKTPLLGFVDDAIVVGFVVDKTRQALDDFMIWETNGVSNLG